MKKFLARVKKNNKGFTLVELIIVIAIIAVLSAVLAPQYIKYVENSREATDKNCLDEYAHAAEIAVVGDGTTQPTSTSFSFTITSGKVTLTGGNDLAEAVEDIVPDGSYTFTSKQYKTTTPKITVSVTDGAAKWEAAA